MKYINPVKAAFFLEDAIEQEKKRCSEHREAKNNKEFIKQLEENMDEKQQMALEFISEHAFSQSEHNIHWMEKLLTLIK